MTLLIALLLFAALAAPGVVLLRRRAPELSFLEQLAYGVPLGMVAGTLALFVFACLFGFTPVEIVVVTIAWAALAWPLGAGDTRARSWRDDARATLGAARTPDGLAAALVLALLTARFALLWATVLRVDAGGLSAGWVNLWADWGMHLGDVASFAWGANFPPVHPRLWGHPYAYHFLSSVTPAAAVRLGLDPLVAVPLHSFLLGEAILLGLYAFARRMLGGRGAAALAVVLFVLGGGWGWWLPLANALHAGPAAFFARPWSQALADAANLKWQNVWFSMVGPQRSCLYGLPLGLLVLTLLDVATRTRGRRAFALAGLAAGFLPLAHQGTLLTLVITTPFLFLLFPSARWVAFFGVWALVGLPQEVWLTRGGTSALASIRFHLGWIAAPTPWPWFWLANLGFFLPLAVVGYAWRAAVPPHARRFLLAFLPAFAIANLWLLLPWDWDNTKVLTFWLFSTCLLAAGVIATAWRRVRSPVVRALLVVVVLSLTLSGVLVNLDEALDRDRNLWLTTEELDLARVLRERTPPHAVIATGMRPNQPVTLLSGRRVIAGYVGWLWAQGLAYGREERDLRAILACGPGTDSLMARYGVAAVVIGPDERANGASDSAWTARAPLLLSTANYRVYDAGARRLSARDASSAGR